jgi:4-hydroxy-4-methyl-2-oxoglutarate aldolase
MVHARKDFDRPDSKIVEAFRKHSSATIHEASGRSGYISYRIKPIAKKMRVCGPALTVECPPGDNMMLHKALELAKQGDVIVATVAGAEDYGYWGDLMAVSAVSRKLGGLCIEGCVRDSEEIIELGFPIFSTGLCIRGTEKGTLGLVNYPIFFGGQRIEPGDLIVGDDDGLVVIVRKKCAEVLEKTEARVAAEVEKAKVLATGISSVEYNKLKSKFEALGFLEE